jgi:hypothetical protein
MAKAGKCENCGEKWKDCWNGDGVCCDDCQHPTKD